MRINALIDGDNTNVSMVSTSVLSWDSTLPAACCLLPAAYCLLPAVSTRSSSLNQASDLWMMSSRCCRFAMR